MSIFDVSAPTAPVLLGSATSADGAGFVGVAAKGGVAYTASPSVIPGMSLGGLYVWNVGTPSSPQGMGNYNGLYDAWGIAQTGTLAVATGNSLGLKVVDVSTPTAPKVRGVLSGTMRAVAMVGQYAYVLNVVPGNPAHVDLIVVSLATPSAPAIVGRLTL